MRDRIRFAVFGVVLWAALFSVCFPSGTRKLLYQGPVALYAQYNSINPGDTVSGQSYPTQLDQNGNLKVNPVFHTAPSMSNPSLVNNTSTTLVVAGTWNYIEIDNGSSTTLAVSLNGATITGTTPGSSNNVIDIGANGSWHSPPNWTPTTAITGYQSSGGAINTVTVTTG